MKFRKLNEIKLRKLNEIKLRKLNEIKLRKLNERMNQNEKYWVFFKLNFWLNLHFLNENRNQLQI